MLGQGLKTIKPYQIEQGRYNLRYIETQTKDTPVVHIPRCVPGPEAQERTPRVSRPWVQGRVDMSFFNGHRNSGFTHWKWWFSIVILVYYRENGNGSTGWWFWPSWKIWKSIGKDYPIYYGKNQNDPNHQPGNSPSQESGIVQLRKCLSLTHNCFRNYP